MLKKRKKGKKIKFKESPKKESPKEVIIKTKTDWLKKALVNKKKYEKNYNNSIKKVDININPKLKPVD